MLSFWETEEMSALEKWQNGVELNFAFFEYAGEMRRNQFRNSRNQAATKLEMYFDLYTQLGNSELEAWGLRSDLTLDRDPVRIPPFVFREPPILSNCERDLVEFEDWKFLKVKISKSRGDFHETAGNNTRAQNQVKGRVGRPSAYHAAKAALITLADRDKALILKSASRLLGEFNREYIIEAPKFGLPPAPLSERALRAHLKQFRQELAETGKNDNAI